MTDVPPFRGARYHVRAQSCHADREDARIAARGLRGRLSEDYDVFVVDTEVDAVELIPEQQRGVCSKTACGQRKQQQRR